MQTSNIPIQVFCVVSTIGDLTPVRFRYEAEDHRILTVPITEILCQKETKSAGSREIIFTCTANMEGSIHLFNLKYNVNHHRWIFAKFLVQ